MQNQDYIKRKNDLFHSIMSNPKLARTFKEAVSSPIGSTKREQAKSILSIMKKVGGVNMQDGQGGPMNSSTPMMINSTSNTTPVNDFSNLMVFPALPNFKLNNSTSSSIDWGLDKPSTLTNVSTSLSSIPNALNNIKPIVTSTSTGNAFDGPKSTTSLLTPFNSPSQTPTNYKQVSPVVKPKEIDYKQLVKDNPINPGLKQILSPSNLWDGLKSLLSPGVNVSKKVGDIVAAIPGAAIGATGVALSPIEAGVRTVTNPTFWKNLWGGTNPGDPSGIVSPTDTTAWKIAKGFTVDSPWIKDLAGTNSNTTSPVATPTNTTTPTISDLSETLSPAVLTALGITSPTSATSTSSTTNTTDVTNIKKAQDVLYKAGYMTPEQYKSEYGTIGTSTTAAYTQAQSDATSGTYTGTNTSGTTNITTKDVSNPSTTYTNTSGTYVPTGNVDADVANAVASGEGATAFGMDYADSKFGGGLDEYVAKLDTKLKSDFKISEYEQALTDLKDKGSNLIPTLQSYISGKDQYLKFIDNMIEQVENQATTKDLSDPADLASYNRQLNYLYTLKGRQNTRYGNFLNSAVADYNADVTKATDVYNTAYKEYSDAMTQQGTMAQNEYNNLYTRMSSAYTELQNAPINAANLKAVQIQNDINSGTILDTANGGLTTNPKRLADINTYSDAYLNTDKTDTANYGTLDKNKVTTEGLAGLYMMILSSQGDAVALTETIRRGLAKSLQNDQSTTNVDRIKTLITDLKNSGYGDQSTQWANTLQTQLFGDMNSSLAGAVKSKISIVKNAINDLVNQHGGRSLPS